MTATESTSGRLSSRHKMTGRPALAQVLGWFSVGLGAAEVAMPGTMSKLFGVRGRHRELVRSMGIRELAAGVGILAQRRPTPFVWARVAGDALDLSLLGLALSSNRTNRTRAAIATAAAAGVTALDLICGAKLAREEGPVLMRESIAVNKTPEECYRLWRNFESIPRFMKHIESVTAAGEQRSRWSLRAPTGVRVEWDADIAEDQQNERIVWRSVEGSDIDSLGEVRFERGPGGRGTIVFLDMVYGAPGRQVVTALAKLFGEAPARMAREGLRNFKRLIEAGEILTTEGQSSGRESAGEGRPAERGRERGDRAKQDQQEQRREEQEYADMRGGRR